MTIVLRDEASDLFQLFINKDHEAYIPVSCLLLYQDTKGEGFRIVNWGTKINLATGDPSHRPVLLRQSFHSQTCAKGPPIDKKDSRCYLLGLKAGKSLIIKPACCDRRIHWVHTRSYQRHELFLSTAITITMVKALATWIPIRTPGRFLRS